MSAMAQRAARLARRGQRRAESLMADECTIRPVTGETTDPVTGVVTPIYGALVYGPNVLPSEGKCKVQNQRLRYPEEPNAGEHSFLTAVTEIHLPVADDASSVRAQHVIEITASLNAANVGRRLRVKSLDLKTYQTAVRLITEEVLA